MATTKRRQYRGVEIDTVPGSGYYRAHPTDPNGYMCPVMADTPAGIRQSISDVLSGEHTKRLDARYRASRPSLAEFLAARRVKHVWCAEFGWHDALVEH